MSDVVVPVHDLNPVRRTPWITYLLLGINIVVFLVTPAATSIAAQGGGDLREVCRQQAFYERYGAVPREMVENEPLPAVPTGEVGTGPGGPGCVVGPRGYDKEPALSVLTSMFLHGSWLHLLGNMLFLWVFGNNVEDRFGRPRFLLFYLFGGYLAAYGFALANPEVTQPLVGASGAVSAVLGAYLVLFPRARVWSLVPVLFFIPLRLPAWFVLGLWFLLQWVYSTGYSVAQGAVAYLAHVLGFVAGMIAGLPMRRRRPMPPWYGYPYPPGYPGGSWRGRRR